MKKLKPNMKKYLIIFVLVAYISPILFSSIFNLSSFFNTSQAVMEKKDTVTPPPPILNNTNKESFTKDNLEKFADTTFNEALKNFNVPGAVFTVVKGNNVLFEKGYGYSDIDKKIPVDPKTTVFRIASVSKLFTTTAVMQLKEKGIVNFKEDINKYLKDFKIKNKYSKPVTIENLLTHTGGFDERIIGECQTKSYKQQENLKDTLISRPHPIIREPGEAPQYSNYGMSLAGYIVESMTSTPFHKYIEDNIFKPLNMNNSSFIFDKKTLDNLSNGYDYKNGNYKKLPIHGEKLSPAGGLKTTADDMAKFIIAHLNQGVYNNISILNKATMNDMHKKHFPLDINIPDMCYGFQEIYINGVRVMGHGGDDYGFHSTLQLIPDCKLGFFISTNGDNGANLCGNIVSQFMNRYFPKTKNQNNTNTEIKFTKSNLKELEGSYIPSRYPRNEIGKLVLLMFPPTKIKSTSDTLIIKYPGGESIYKEISPLVFKNVEFEDTFAFKSNKHGEISYIINNGSTFAQEKIHWYENPTLHKIIFILFSVLFLCITITMIIMNFKKKCTNEPLLFKYNRWIILFISVLNLIFLLGMTKKCIALSSSLIFLPELPKMIIFLLIIPIITTICTLGMMISTCIYWKREKMNSRIIIGNILICCVFLIFSLFLNYWNLLGFKF